MMLWKCFTMLTSCHIQLIADVSSLTQVNYLISCSVMLVQAKRKEIMFKARQRAQNDKKKVK